MSAVKTIGSTTQYHVTDAQGNHAYLRPGVVAQTIEMVSGGNVITLSKANIADLLAALTAFSTSGVLS